MSYQAHVWVRRITMAATAVGAMYVSGCAAVVPTIVATGFEVYRQSQKTVVETSAATAKAVIDTSAYAARTAARAAREEAVLEASRAAAEARAYIPPRSIVTTPVPISQAARQMAAASGRGTSVTPQAQGSLRVVGTIPAEPLDNAATAEVNYDQMRMLP
ncbi:MAG: hypothetical protein IT444_02340 [Phycisphaeraceae bacterium]|nr:hypothetical protein [Phycisphaeraceae bacterium]